jgi:hypothetical protein
VAREYLNTAPFLKREKRDRYREILSTPSLRHKFISQLAHFSDFDPKYRLSLNEKLLVHNIAFKLKNRRCPNIVYAISEDPVLDQKELPLSDVLPKIVGSGMGTVLCCSPGRLAFVETEDERFILERHEPPEKHKYIRFVIGQTDEVSNVERGIFQAAADALDGLALPDYDVAELNQLQAWFDNNLERPASFGRGALHLGICWFKTNATEHISRLWEMVGILERNGIYVQKIRTDKPGYVVYADDWQIVAEPFRKGTLPRKQ